MSIRSHGATLVFALAIALVSSEPAAQCVPGVPGCPSPSGGPKAMCVTQPDVCSPLTVLFGIAMENGAPLSPAFLLIGPPTPAPVVPVPQPPACSAGCALHFLPTFIHATSTDASGHAQWDVALPCDPSLVGVFVHTPERRARRRRQAVLSVGARR
jgi:hypothetical protein